MMVLYCDQGKITIVQTSFCGIVRGMHIYCKQRRPDPEQAEELRQGLFIKERRFEILEIADVLTEEGFLSFPDAKTIGQFCPEGQDTICVQTGSHRGGDISTRTTEEPFLAIDHPDDGIISAVINVTVMQDNGFCTF
jgi:hypothetical protein